MKIRNTDQNYDNESTPGSPGSGSRGRLLEQNVSLNGHITTKGKKNKRKKIKTKTKKGKFIILILARIL